jgi:hypothetical protein
MNACFVLSDSQHHRDLPQLQNAHNSLQDTASFLSSWYSAGQEIPCVYKTQRFVTVLILTTHILTFNLMLPSPSLLSSSNCFLSLRFSINFGTFLQLHQQGANKT